MPHPSRVTMVCTGNICRSPMAMVILRDLLDRDGLGDRVTVTSAGTQHWEEGSPADPRTVRTLEAHGYDGSAHVASVFTPASFDDTDLVLAADSGHVRELRRMARSKQDRDKIHLLREWDPEAVAAGTLTIDDPWYGDLSDFERCYDEVLPACQGLAKALREKVDSPSQ